MIVSHEDALQSFVCFCFKFIVYFYDLFSIENLYKLDNRLSSLTTTFVLMRLTYQMTKE